jgi:hypothetical protein
MFLIAGAVIRDDGRGFHCVKKACCGLLQARRCVSRHVEEVSSVTDGRKILSKAISRHSLDFD